MNLPKIYFIVQVVINTFYYNILTQLIRKLDVTVGKSHIAGMINISIWIR